MKAETLKNIFYFLEGKEGASTPWLWKHMNNIPLTKEDLIVNDVVFQLKNSKTTSLPEGLKVGGDLDIVYTKLQKYTDDELREMVEPGFIGGKIIRDMIKPGFIGGKIMRMNA